MSCTAEQYLTKKQKTRKALGLTQAKVAEDLHIDTRTVFIIESGVNISEAKRNYKRYIELMRSANSGANSVASVQPTRSKTNLKTLEKLKAKAERLGLRLVENNIN